MDNLFNKISAADLEKVSTKIPSRYGVLTKDGIMLVGPEDGILYEAAKIAYERNIRVTARMSR